MWQALLFDAFALPLAIGTAWCSIAKGRLVYRGTQHITREDNPVQFWLRIGVACLWCALALRLTKQAIIDGSSNT